MKIWVVIPGFNEEKYLGRVLRRTLISTKNVVYVDDGSSDRSVSIARKYLKHILIHTKNKGKGAALKTGCDYVFGRLKADAVVLMDSDDQHNPAELGLFFEKLESGAKIVLGVRPFSSSMPLERRLGNWFVSGIIFLLFSSFVPDVLSGYKAFRRSAYKKLHWRASDYGVELEMAAKIARRRLPFSVVKITTIYHDLERGMTFKDAVKSVARIVQARLG